MLQSSKSVHCSLGYSDRLPEPILVVAGGWGVDDANALVGGLPPVRVLEKTSAITKEHGYNVDFHLVDQTGLQVLLGHVCAAAQVDVFAARRVLGPLKRRVNAFGDKMKGRPALHFERLAGM